MENLRIILKDGTRRIFTETQWVNWDIVGNFLDVANRVKGTNLIVLRIPIENVLLIERF